MIDLRDFALSSNKKIKELSKGTKMKFSLAIALSHNAEPIIMDEPTAGLDPVFRRKLCFMDFYILFSLLLLLRVCYLREALYIPLRLLL
jgi:ABC-type Na+ transport system ATPase subunit NatA